MAHEKLKTFHLFAGAGGGILADLLLGHIPVGACEIEEYPRNVLLQRQEDGCLPFFPVWDDVCTLDGRPWRGSVDVLCGGFPCTDISPARTNSNVNGRQQGLDGNASGLWWEYLRLVTEIKPNLVWVENSPNLRSKGLDAILSSLNALGYNAAWGVLGSRDVGADHHRERMWILAHAHQPQCEGGGISSGIHQKNPNTLSASWRATESRLDRVANGVASGLDANWGKRLKAIGNGQDPRVAATAFRILHQSLLENF